MKNELLIAYVADVQPFVEFLEVATDVGPTKTQDLLPGSRDSSIGLKTK